MTRTHATVLLLVPSPIAAAGLRAIASRTPDCDITAVDTTADALHDDVARLRPTLLVADPMALRTADIPALRQLAGGRLRVAALYTSALPRDITAAYDDFISIYAPADAVHAIVADAVRHSRRTEAADNPDADTDRRELSPREKEVSGLMSMTIVFNRYSTPACCARCINLSAYSGPVSSSLKV